MPTDNSNFQIEVQDDVEEPRAIIQNVEEDNKKKSRWCIQDGDAKCCLVLDIPQGVKLLIILEYLYFIYFITLINTEAFAKNASS